MGSNSSTIQQQAVNDIQTELNAEGIVNVDIGCTISNVTIISTCPPPKFINSCTNQVQVTSTAVLAQTAQTTFESLSEQSSQNGMMRFLNFNSSTTYQEVLNTLTAKVSNKCVVTAKVTALITNLELIITKRPCLQSAPIYNIASNDVQCTLNTTMNVFADAELNATTTQRSGGFGNGSSGDEGCAQALIILVVVMLFLGIIVLFFFRHKKNSLARASAMNPKNNDDDDGGRGDEEPRKKRGKKSQGSKGKSFKLSSSQISSLSKSLKGIKLK